MHTHDQPYVGENVLHIAIVRRLDRKVLKLFVESDEGQALMEARATGSFFRIPNARAEEQQGAESDSAPCCHYGELALAFAVCTNQRDTFDYLLANKAKLHIKTLKEGHNLLHLLVLHSVHKNHQHAEAEEDDEKKVKDENRWCHDMYDYVQEKMEQTIPSPQELEELQVAREDEQNWYTVLSMEADHENLTPLTLCAARGSREMFRHLFRKLMELQWQFGFVKCHLLPLAGVDQPFKSDLHEHNARRKPSVLQVVVKYNRMDLLGQGDLIKVLDNKWDKYAKKWFQHRLWRQAFFTFLMLFISCVDLDEARAFYGSEGVPSLKPPSWDVTVLQLFMHTAEVVAPLTLGVVFVREAHLVLLYGFEREMLSGHVCSLLTLPVTLCITLFRWSRCTCPSNEYMRSLWLCEGESRAFWALFFFVAMVMALACLAYYSSRNKTEACGQLLYHAPCSLWRALRTCVGAGDGKTHADHGLLGSSQISAIGLWRSLRTCVGAGDGKTLSAIRFYSP